MQSNSARSASITVSEYRAFQHFLEQASGILLGPGKEYLVSSRLGTLMRENRISGLGELLRQIESNSRLRTAVIDAMTTNETFWFRDVAHFRMLSERVFDELIERRKGTLRIWSAACSTGQEPYNLSMVVDDYQRRNPGKLPGNGAEIVATDISSRVLAEARKGIYCGISATRGTTPEQRKRYFIERDDCVEVRPEIRNRVSFREMNLSKGFELLGRFDIIFVRNVLIYFSAEQKRDIIRRMGRLLNPGGYLFLGSTESLSGHSDLFKMVSHQGGIGYRRN